MKGNDVAKINESEFLLKAVKTIIKKDAEDYGDALNEASWAFDEAYREVMGKGTDAKLFNNMKSMVRRSILKELGSLCYLSRDQKKALGISRRNQT